MHPVAPSYEKRFWPVHYIAGWMGLYLRKPFKDKVKGEHLPDVKQLPMQPTMVKTMFRVPITFSPAKARIFLDARANIFWNPYTPKNLVGVDQLQRSFTISSHRGMLPWRRATDVDDLCIAEPYHPDRVARQLTLRQQVPYAPLVSVYTKEDTGVAYAYWSHLLRSDQGEFQYLLNDAQTFSFVAWNNWWVGFMKPFNNIFNTLRPGISNGSNYNLRKRNFLKRGEEYIVPRKLSENDFVVIKEVSARGKEEHIAAIKLNGKRIMDHWRPILCGFLSNDEPLINSKKVRYIHVYIWYYHSSFAPFFISFFLYLLLIEEAKG